MRSNRNRGEFGEGGDPIELDSRRAAMERLETLRSDGFRGYAIRFMNITEYRQALQSGKFEANNNVFVPADVRSDEFRQPVFREYLESSVGRGWEDVIVDEVDWPQSAVTVYMEGRIFKMIKDLRTEVSAEGHDLPMGELRQRFQRQVLSEVDREMARRKPVTDSGLKVPFHHDEIENSFDLVIYAKQWPVVQQRVTDLRGLVSSEHGAESEQKIHTALIEALHEGTAGAYRSFWNRVDNGAWTSGKMSEAAYMAVNELLGIEEEIFTLGGEAVIRDIQAWIKDPLSVPLRTIVQELTRFQINGFDNKQYHLAVLLRSDAVNVQEPSFANPGRRRWGSVRTGIGVESVLGVVSIVSERGMLEDLVDLNVRAGRAAHPVFTSRGRVAFPKS